MLLLIRTQNFNTMPVQPISDRKNTLEAIDEISQLASSGPNSSIRNLHEDGVPVDLLISSLQMSCGDWNKT